MSEDHELLLAKPARDAVRMLLRRRLKAASRAAARLGDPADLAALHGFRTAVRRFRTLERAFRPWAPGRLKGGPLRPLKAVVAATNPARDAQVQTAILDDVARSAAPSERRAIDDFVAVRRELERRTVEDARLGVTAAWPDVEARLRRALRKRRTPRPWDAPPSTFAAAAASAARTAATRLRLLLAEAARSGDAVSVHAARIAAKRLRYILEACVAEAPGVAEAADRARSMQDALGLLRDRQLLLAEFDGAQSREESAAAVASLRATLRPAVGDAFDAFKALADVRSPSPSAVAAALLGRRDASDDASVECERKFLLSRVPPETNGAPWYRVDQGWLPGLRLKERIRRTRTPDGRARYWRTVKSGSGVARFELEEETSKELFKLLWPATRGRRIRKRRYLVEDGPATWEIDVFKGRDLVLAEIELPSEDAPVAAPEWLRPYLVREVTEDPSYSNSSLAR